MKLRPWQNHIAADLATVLDRVESGIPTHLGFIRPLVRAALVEEGMVPGCLLLLCARASGSKADLRPTLHAFAAAMELITLSLHAHSRLPEHTAQPSAVPLLSLGSAAGVLFGDLLYTHAFAMIVRCGHREAIAEMATATEHMVIASTRERVRRSRVLNSPSHAFNSSLAAACRASCSLAALLTGTSAAGRTLLRNFGVLCGAMRQRNAQSTGAKPAVDKMDALYRRSADRCLSILAQALPASPYRDDLELFVADRHP
jgi:octaprenyl-diphosphate synthase